MCMFAVESVSRLRACLASAWDVAGLCASAVCGVRAWTCSCTLTPECCEFSARHHDRSRGAQSEALGVMYRALRYVRINRPRRVIVENVDEPCGCQPIGGLLGSSRISIDQPTTTAGNASARRRTTHYAGKMMGWPVWWHVHRRKS